MGRSRVRASGQIVLAAQWAATLGLMLFAVAAVGWVVLAAAGVLPWLTLPVTLGDTIYANAGMAVQIGVALFLMLTAFLVPSGHRVMKLEQSHRDFSICMSDVADAYRACHAADRQGAFTLGEQFDAVKDRIAFLRQHPDLGHLEFDVLEAAAQMSAVSRELAETYSDEKVERARRFLRERQEEVTRFQDKIVEVNAEAHQLRRWLENVEVEESMMRSQIDRLEDQLGDTLSALGFTRRRRDNVLPYPQLTAAE